MIVRGIKSRENVKTVNKNLCRSLDAVRIEVDSRSEIQHYIVRETSVEVHVDGIPLISLLCLPVDLRYLGVGFLYTERFFTGKDDMISVESSSDPHIISIQTTDKEIASRKIISKRTITSGCGKGIIFRTAIDSLNPTVDSEFTIPISRLETLWNNMGSYDDLYRCTRGVHSSALCSREEILYFSADIGRHNTLDRLAGKCFLEDIPASDKIVFCTGRFSSEMVLKLGTIGIPIAISRSTPTDTAVDLASKLNICLGSTKNMKQLIVYTHPWRIENGYT
jgi:FdhD protein